MVIFFLLALFVSVTAKPLQWCPVSGIELKSNQEWREGNFIKKCITGENFWTTVVVACLSPAGIRIEAGSSLKEGGSVHNCQRYNNGEVRLQVLDDIQEEKPAETSKSAKEQKCRINGKTKSHNEEWREGSFVIKCLVQGNSWNMKPFACLTPAGTKVFPESTVTEDNSVYTCERQDEGLKLTHAPIHQEAKCVIDGKERKQNEEWRKGEFVMKCFIESDRWNARPVACFSPDGNRVNIGQTVIKGEYQYECKKRRNGRLKLHVERASGYGQQNTKTQETTTKPSIDFSNDAVTCNIHGELRDPNEEWLENCLYKKCLVENNKWKVEIVACCTPKPVCRRLELGASITEGDYTYTCKRHLNGSVNLHITEKSKGPSFNIDDRPDSVTAGNKMRCPYNGKQKSNTEEWRVGSFLMKCLTTDRSWKTQVVACYSPSGARLTIGEKITEGTWTYICEQLRNGTIKLDVEPAKKVVASDNQPTILAANQIKCIYKGQKRNNNEEWVVGSFMMKCITGTNQWRTEVVACFSPAGARLHVAERITEGKWTYVCEILQDGSLALSSEPAASQISRNSQTENDHTRKPTSCYYKGKSYKNGQEWRENNFGKKCIIGQNSWKIEISACFTPKNARLDVGSKIREGKWTYQCENLGNGYVKLNVY